MPLRVPKTVCSGLGKAARGGIAGFHRGSPFLTNSASRLFDLAKSNNERKR
nr:hypothetical protein [Stanieria cyanosphaera]